MNAWLRAQLALAVDAKSPKIIGHTSWAALSRSESDDSTESVQLTDDVVGRSGAGSGLGLGAGEMHADSESAAMPTRALRAGITTRWFPSSSCRRLPRRRS